MGKVDLPMEGTAAEVIVTLLASIGSMSAECVAIMVS